MAPHNSSENGGDVGLLLFDKVYDALSPPVANKLGGTCLTGQLIQDGYEQEYVNGRILRETYIDTKKTFMQLFDSTRYSDRPYERSTRFRGDDQQRTLMSGQTLVKSLFDVDTNGTNIIVPYHTADYPVDPIKPDTLICPKLTDLRDEAVKSDEYVARNFSEDVLVLENILSEDLGGGNWRNIMDCLMTQKCNKRSIPPILDDFKHDGDNSFFSRVAEHASWMLTYIYRHNNAAYSKLAMGPLWAEIFSFMSEMTAGGNGYGARTLGDMKKKDIPVLLLYSGHDTTLMPILATLGENVWDGTWSPYASMLVIETYAVVEDDPKFPSTYAFRIIYNGEVLTPKIHGCDSDLCDYNFIKNMIEPFATWDRDCASAKKITHPPSKASTKQMKKTASILVWVLATLFVCFVSSVFTALYVTSYNCGSRKGLVRQNLQSYGATNDREREIL